MTRFLYDIIIQQFGKQYLENLEVPNYITGNLKHRIRPYQKEAFQRYMLFQTEDFAGKPNKPFHLLYNMATGSGKTLVMAGLILYLYKNGYRNFLFFVNSNNIIKKTKENFLNPLASKYLFSEKIVIDGKVIQIKEVENFEEADKDNINIKFTTIQQLHIDLNSIKENGITYEDFKNQKLALIADEAHHLSSGTKSGNLEGSWEDTVVRILEQNKDNILLEFTATLEYKNSEIAEKYKNKVLFKYELAQFRLDGYSKDIHLIRSHYDEKERIIQALILNLYRQELAALHGINLKPVILFKAKRSINESEQNKAGFHKLIAQLSTEDIKNIKKNSKVEVIQRALRFFETNDISPPEIVKRIRSNFKENHCISANNDSEAERNQILLNTLEDVNNPIRAVFAVQKLNEGWDVLNLFDIVRLYDGRDSKAGKAGKTTLSEAQLIGRGARYFPFVTDKRQEPYKRKFDNDPDNDLRVLEELYYHTREDSRYISELKKALVETGIYEDDEKLETKHLTLKPEFKQTNFYKKAKVVFNQKVVKSFSNIKSFNDLGIKKRNFIFNLSSGAGKKTGAFQKIENSKTAIKSMSQKNIKLSDIPSHIIRFALTQNPFYYFENLRKSFPNLVSTSGFIINKDYLGSLEITFKGPKTRLQKISNEDYLMALQGLLQNIEADIKAKLTKHTCSDWTSDYVQNIFKDKKIKVHKNSERSDGQEALIANKSWYIFNANYGTNEQKKFVESFAKYIKKLEMHFEHIYLIKNEKHLKIYDKKGRGFEPDFILFCQQKAGEERTYQILIELPGEQLKTQDKWKANFLDEIRDQKIIFDKTLITTVSFNEISINELEDNFNNLFHNLNL